MLEVQLKLRLASEQRLQRRAVLRPAAHVAYRRVLVPDQPREVLVVLLSKTKTDYTLPAVRVRRLPTAYHVRHQRVLLLLRQDVVAVPRISHI